MRNRSKADEIVISIPDTPPAQIQQQQGVKRKHEDESIEKSKESQPAPKRVGYTHLFDTIEKLRRENTRLEEEAMLYKTEITKIQINSGMTALYNRISEVSEENERISQEFINRTLHYSNEYTRLNSEISQLKNTVTQLQEENKRLQNQAISSPLSASSMSLSSPSGFFKSNSGVNSNSDESEADNEASPEVMMLCGGRYRSIR